MKPLFKWAGGKTSMLKHYEPYMPVAGSVETYCEPFFGGGAMFIEVMRRYDPKRVFINDLNSGIINIYNAVGSDVDNFLRFVDEYEEEYLPLSHAGRKELYYKIRAKHAWDYQNLSKVEEAAALYFLMKTSFNGLWLIRGVTNGRFGTACGDLNHKKKVIDKNNILEWSEVLSCPGVMITSEDYNDLEILKEDTTGMFVFLDPPYRETMINYQNGKKVENEDSFGDDEHRKLVKMVIESRKRTVLLANSDVGDGFFDNVPHIKIPKTYVAARSTIGAEKRPQSMEVLVYTQK